MKINRAWLGGAEEINLDDPHGLRYFKQEVVHNDEVADYYIGRLEREGEFMVNVDDAEYVERWTVLP